MAIIVMRSEVGLPRRGTDVCLDVDRTANAWAFGSPRDAHFGFTADVEVNDRPPMPPNLAGRRSTWNVGFIQNIVSETLNLSYDNMQSVSLTISTPCLDAMPESVPWICRYISDVLHFGQVQGVNTFWSQGPGKSIQFRISMADWPRFTVYNFYGGGSYPGNGRNQIRSIESITHFRTWIAAREESSPSTLASNYILLQMIDFAIKVTTTLSPNGVNPLFREEYRVAQLGSGLQQPNFASLNVQVQYGASIGGRFVEGSIGWRPPTPHIRPVVVRPLANEITDRCAEKLSRRSLKCLKNRGIQWLEVNFSAQRSVIPGDSITKTAAFVRNRSR